MDPARWCDLTYFQSSVFPPISFCRFIGWKKGALAPRLRVFVLAVCPVCEYGSWSVAEVEVKDETPFHTGSFILLSGDHFKSSIRVRVIKHHVSWLRMERQYREGWAVRRHPNYHVIIIIPVLTLSSLTRFCTSPNNFKYVDFLKLIFSIRRVKNRWVGYHII